MPTLWLELYWLSLELWVEPSRDLVSEVVT